MIDGYPEKRFNVPFLTQLKIIPTKTNHKNDNNRPAHLVKNKRLEGIQDNGFILNIHQTTIVR